MNLRDDEIAFLGTERCYCGHLESLHGDMDGFDSCFVSDDAHHFCSLGEEVRHFDEQERIRGNPAVGRSYQCRECEKARLPA
jgi:hypothetical protein